MAERSGIDEGQQHDQGVSRMDQKDWARVIAFFSLVTLTAVVAVVVLMGSGAIGLS